ncbi:GTP cyclohydrolase [Actinomadura barringtoniae]|uniref:GTP cyclohydrolase n=1 Tax=Actinomadura barringtoniae TaxID=1427535 RepID=A0A939TG97_9ACTN|nr:YciI family protein [Actinomadura barringtoniae]MBO2455215.1 GTP cyclohydrolase [Actinomadura barringtoniae]
MLIHLLTLRYTGTEDDVAPHVGAHVEYLERHHGDGTFLASGQTVPSSEGGAIIACGIDRAEAERITSTDPFVRAGVAAYTITTIEAARLHPALAAAF